MNSGAGPALAATARSVESATRGMEEIRSSQANASITSKATGFRRASGMLTDIAFLSMPSL